MPGLENCCEVLLSRSARETAARASFGAGCSPSDRASVVRARATQGEATLARPTTSLRRHRLRQHRSPPAPRFLWRGTSNRGSLAQNQLSPPNVGEEIAGRSRRHYNFAFQHYFLF